MKKTEKELVRLACEGDREAYRHLVEPHLPAVFSTAQALLMNSADAEEVAQESLLKALRNICQFRREAKFSTWLVQITIEESRQRLRKYRKHLYRTLEEITDNDGCQRGRFADKSEIPLKALERKQLGDALQLAIASLPQKYREVLTLRDIQQLSTKETARILGLSLQNVKIRLLRARLQMRDALAPDIDGKAQGDPGPYT